MAIRYLRLFKQHCASSCYKVTRQKITRNGLQGSLVSIHLISVDVKVFPKRISENNRLLLLRKTVYLYVLAPQILVSLGLGWILSYILTATGTFTEDKDNIEYKARTDFNAEAIAKANWFYFPYPSKLASPIR